MNFSETQALAPKTAEKVVVLSPMHFAAEWPARPEADVAIGLRRLSERDVKVAKEMGRKIIHRDHVRDGKIVDLDMAYESYNDELIRYLMARATVNPNDSALPYFQMAEDTIHQALTSEGVKKLWDAWTVLNLTGAAAQIATDDEVKRLARILKDPERMAALGAGQVEGRKLVAYLLDGFGALDVEEEEAEEEDEGYSVVSVPDEAVTTTVEGV